MDSAQIPAPQLGRILIAAGLISEEQLAEALEEQAQTGQRLGEIIVQRGFISGPALANALAEQHGRVLKTEYGFASGLGGVVARRAAAEAGAPVSPLRAPEPTPISELDTAKPASPAGEELAAPVEPPPPAPPLLGTTEGPAHASERTPVAEAAEPLPEPVELRPQVPEAEPTSPAEAPEPVPEPAAAAPDDRDALIDSLHARIEAQAQELAKLREELEHARAQRDVQVHVWPEDHPPAPTAAPAQTEHYLLCVPTTAGYVLLNRVGPLPSIGHPVEVPEEEGKFTVAKIVRLPRNGRPCAYLQRA